MEAFSHNGYKVASLGKLARAFIWAPRALVGKNLVPEKNLLLEIKKNRIVNLLGFPGGDLPPEKFLGESTFCLGEGLTLMPSLMDAHVHLALDGEDFKEAVSRWDCGEELKERINRDLAAFLNRGTGFIRDGGDAREINLAVKNRVKGGGCTAPGVIATGQALRKAESYGSFLGGGFSSKKEINEQIDRSCSEGVDQLKVLVSGIVSFKEYGKVGKVKIDREELTHIVSRARQWGIKVMAHASSEEAVKTAVHAGVDSVEHGYFLSRESLCEMAERGVAWVPTVIPVAAQVREPRRWLWSSREIELITRIYREQQEKIQMAHECGVLLGMGTDSGAAGVKHGKGLLEEIKLYVGAGLSQRQALISATSNNAAVLGLETFAGSLEINRAPCLVAVRGDPLSNLEALQQVEWVFVS